MGMHGNVREFDSPRHFLDFNNQTEEIHNMNGDNIQEELKEAQELPVVQEEVLDDMLSPKQKAGLFKLLDKFKEGILNHEQFLLAFKLFAEECNEECDEEVTPS